MIRSVILLCMMGMAFAVFAGCDAGGGGSIIAGGTPTTAASVAPAVITTSQQAAEASSAVLQAKELIVTSTDLSMNLGLLAQSLMVSSTTGTGTGVCTDYGTYTYTRNYYASQSNYSVSITFSLCRQNGFQFDGSFSAIGRQSDFTVNLANLKIMNFQNNYTTLIGSLVGSSARFQIQGSGVATSGTYTVTANGGISAFDYYSLGQHSMSYSNLITHYAVATDNTAGTRAFTYNANGGYSVRVANRTAALAFVDFVVSIQRTIASQTDDISITGRVQANYTPDSALEGAFDVTTATPVRMVHTPYPAKTTQGALSINGSASIAYGATNAISVSVAGDTALNYAKEFMLMKVGDFYALEQQLPLVSGTTGSASGTVMSLSALSTDPSTTSGLSCYTDVHVKYYVETAPTPTNTYKWMVHWNSDLTTCVSTSAIPFQEATSSTGVPTDTCDVGLDINGSAQDITSGGIEHFLAAKLPVGYYVLSINNYSCGTTVRNDATILVGDYLFGPYACTYTTRDTDGTTPGAWCRLTDIRVNAGGSVDVLSPNTSLTPWH